jgi:acetyl-CoA acetyltransferase family protein
MPEAYIYDAVRTPRGKGKSSGALHEITALSLGTQVLQAIRDRNSLDTSKVDDVVFGCVSPVGEQGGDIARIAVLNADYAETTAGVQVDRFCASGLEACNMAASKVMTGEADMAIGGGVESMSRVPMGTPAILALKAGMGSYMSPNIQERYPNIQFSQFAGAEMIAKKYGFTKDMLDEFGFSSHQKAIAATQSGAFGDEIVAVEITLADGSKIAGEADGGMYKLDHGRRHAWANFELTPAEIEALASSPIAKLQFRYVGMGRAPAFTAIAEPKKSELDALRAGAACLNDRLVHLP